VQMKVPSRAALGLGPPHSPQRGDAAPFQNAASFQGLVLEASTQAAGAPGTAAMWVAPAGTPATRALWCGGRTSCGCVDTACARGLRGPGPWFFLGARCATKCQLKQDPPTALGFCVLRGGLSLGMEIFFVWALRIYGSS
jgi:hypothetical protein